MQHAKDKLNNLQNSKKTEVYKKYFLVQLFNKQTFLLVNHIYKQFIHMSRDIYSVLTIKDFINMEHVKQKDTFLWNVIL